MASATLERRALASWSEGRVWHPVPRAPLPAEEAGRAVICALLNGPGGPRAELRTGADDRAETSLKAIYRRLWRLGHAQRSGAYATTQDQIVAALLPVMGWPDRGSVEANRSAHGRSVRRWLDRLQVMRLIAWRGVRDNRGRWWRIELELLAPPAPDGDALRIARRRLRGFGRREHKRRVRNPWRRRDLGCVVARSARPTSPTRARAAQARATAVRDARARRGPLRRSTMTNSKVRSNPFGAPPSVALTPTTPSPLEALLQREHAADRTDARTRVAPSPDENRPSQTDHDRIDDHYRTHNPKERIEGDHKASRAPSSTRTTQKIGRSRSSSLTTWSLTSSEDEGLLAHIAAVEAAIARGALPPTKFHLLAATRRSAWDALAVWPAGRSVPDRILNDAFDHAVASSRARLPRDGRHRPALDRALARYARYVEHRPMTSDGERWPESAAAALAWVMRDLANHTAHDGEPPASPIYAIGRLNLIAKQMAAEAKRQNAQRELDGIRRRRSRLERAYTRSRIAFRSVQRSPRWGGTTEAHRRAAINAALAGRLPGFDALHGFIVRASDLLGRPNREGRYPSGGSRYPDALGPLGQLPFFLDGHGTVHDEP